MNFFQYLKFLKVKLDDHNKCGSCNRAALYLDCFFPFEVAGNRCLRCYEADKVRQGGE